MLIQVRHRIRIQGVVQGVGFRPFVWKLASRHQCTGWVCNDADGVLIEIQGAHSIVEHIYQLLVVEAPPLAKISSTSREQIDLVEGEANFQILKSRNSINPQALISPDIATCNECLDELNDPNNRRYGYPFINCTHCGPRFTIQISVPYDRRQTTMRSFTMCELCEGEYLSPDSRRFHAQPNACPNCGPTIWYRSKQEIVDSSHESTEALSSAPSDWDGSKKAATNFLETSSVPERPCPTSAVQQVRREIADGRIVAIKGIGGFHLACDAKNSTAVGLLRARKRRPFKPLAVMVADIATAETIVEVTDEAKRLMKGPECPIVLLRKLEHQLLPEVVAPNNPYLGVILPYTPLHHLLLRRGDFWIMTSGNLADEPIAFENSHAIDRLGLLFDGVLLHDRPIYTVCDDSVVRIGNGETVPIRRSRGYAPLPIDLKDEGATALAVGGELKTALCLAKGTKAFLGQHVGDMGNRETVEALERSSEHLLSLYQAIPQYIVADQHPGYLSVQWARQQADRWRVPLIQVQHHHAHAASLIAEHGLSNNQEIIACVFDGTGFGSDGAIWGGEVLIASLAEYRRAAHLQYAPLPGGDSCIMTPAKTALAYLYSCELPWSDELSCVRYFNATELTRLRQQLEKGINTVSTSSMGRLFDAVASLIGISNQIDYEGQAALELEALAESVFRANESILPYSFRWSQDQVAKLLSKAMIEDILLDLNNEVSSSTIAARFHLTIACSVSAICSRLREEHRLHKSNAVLDTVGLTGGVFQNSLLLQLVKAELRKEDFQILSHRTIPPNDGGLALGQVAVARTVSRNVTRSEA